MLHCLLSLSIYRCLMCGIFHWTFLPCVCFFYLVSALWLYLNVSLSHFPLSLRHTRCTSFVSFLYLSSTRFLRLWLYVSVHLPCKLLLYSHALAFSFRLLVILILFLFVSYIFVSILCGSDDIILIALLNKIWSCSYHILLGSHTNAPL